MNGNDPAADDPDEHDSDDPDAPDARADDEDDGDGDDDGGSNVYKPGGTRGQFYKACLLYRWTSRYEDPLEQLDNSGSKTNLVVIVYNPTEMVGDDVKAAFVLYNKYLPGWSSKTWPKLSRSPLGPAHEAGAIAHAKSTLKNLTSSEKVAVEWSPNRNDPEELPWYQAIGHNTEMRKKWTSYWIRVINRARLLIPKGAQPRNADGTTRQSNKRKSISNDLSKVNSNKSGPSCMTKASLGPSPLEALITQDTKADDDFEAMIAQSKEEDTKRHEELKTAISSMGTAIATAFTSGLGEILKELKKQRAEPTGPYGYHHNQYNTPHHHGGGHPGVMGHPPIGFRTALDPLPPTQAGGHPSGGNLSSSQVLAITAGGKSRNETKNSWVDENIEPFLQ
jgi:hypothetical protein